jgi:threonine synthase
MIDPTQTSPARKFWRFLPFSKPEEILDFGLRETELKEAPRLAQWLGVGRCFLKLETTNPTGTVKDRITELTYSLFKKEKVASYAHASTGNTGTSMAWGMRQYPGPFSLTLYIPEQQLSHHNIEAHPNQRAILLKEASYDQAKSYAKKVGSHLSGQSGALSIESAFRKTANKLPYLEALYQCGQRAIQPNYIAQSISSGTGLVGAMQAIQDAMKAGWISKIPGIVGVQPEAANPIIRCLRTGSKTYRDECTIKNPAPSKAWAIRRGDARGCYETMEQLIASTGGFGEDASEAEITAARKALIDLEQVHVGYTAATSLAGIKKKAEAIDLSQATFLVMITGRDRPEIPPTAIDTIVTKDEWSKIIDD